jgi:AcrR family transcriptional regulator
MPEATDVVLPKPARADDPAGIIMSATSQSAIRAPRQQRSQRTMDRVMKALEELLDEKPFERITMIELAQRSRTGTSSIYARFKDKNSLVLGVHGRLTETVFPCLRKLTDPSRWEGKPLDLMLSASIDAVVKFYRQHSHIVRAALLVDQPFVYERQRQVLQFASDSFTALMIGLLPSENRKSTEQAVETAVRIVSAVMHQTLIFQSGPLIRKAISDKDLVRHLTIAVSALVKTAATETTKTRT